MTAVIPLSPPALRRPTLWVPKRVMVTPAALEHRHGHQIIERVQRLGIEVIHLPGNRLTGLRGADERETYRRAKSTLAVVVAPPSRRRLVPIPPSADWRVDLAEGCPAHCQYCYLAGSLGGPPVTRVYANLEELLEAVAGKEEPGRVTSFEAGCYSDVLGIEHLTGSLAETIRWFGTRSGARLRWTTKFDAVDGLLDLPHAGHTQARFSINAAPHPLEGGTAPVHARLAAAGRMAGAGYPVGLVIAPILAEDGWQERYTDLLDDAAGHLAGVEHPTFELITHRFSPGSREVLTAWYPRTKLEMDPSSRAVKRNRYGGVKHVYPAAVMADLRGWFEEAIEERFGPGRILYWT